MAIDVEPGTRTTERPGIGRLRLGRLHWPWTLPVPLPARNGLSLPATRPSLAGRPHRYRPERQVGPAGRVLVIGVICFGVWALLSAPALLHSAETSPLGARRAASLAVLKPLARLSSILSLDRVESLSDRVLDRSLTSPPVGSIPPLPPQAELPVRGGPFKVHPTRPSPGPVPARVHRPTTATPLRVLIVGDSIGSDLGVGLGRILDAGGGFVTRIDARESTGLSRADYFNWPYQIGLDVRSFRPDVVVAMFGANDGQSVALPGGHWAFWGTRQWPVSYGARVGGIMSMLVDSGRPVVWVGMPVMGRPGLNGPLRMINGIDERESRAHPGVVYVDAWSLFANSRGGYAPYLPGTGGGQELVRTADGVHLTGDGEGRLGRAVYAQMSRLWAPG